jgi:hypothetical protein
LAAAQAKHVEGGGRHACLISTHLASRPSAAEQRRVSQAGGRGASAAARSSASPCYPSGLIITVSVKRRPPSRVAPAAAASPAACQSVSVQESARSVEQAVQALHAPPTRPCHTTNPHSASLLRVVLASRSWHARLDGRRWTLPSA